MEQIECSETSTNINQTPGKHPKENTLNTELGESLKSRIKSRKINMFCGQEVGILIVKPVGSRSNVCALTLCRSNLNPYCLGSKAAFFQCAFKYT
jgi:hypothetical protein